MKGIWLALALAALLPALAHAEYYRYQTEEGVLSFTDDLRRVPSRYLDAVERLEPQSLFDHPRVTIVPRGATRSAAPSPLAPAAPSAPAAPTARAETKLEVTTNPSTTLIGLAPQASGPVQIERTTEWRWVDGRYVPFAVVKQDGRTLTVVRLR